MGVLLLLLVILVRATNALECWQGETEITSPGGTKGEMKLEKCSAGGLLVTHCTKLSCSLDEEALKKFPAISPGAKSLTTTAKSCLSVIGECKMPEEGDLNGVSLKKLKKYCKISCCKGNACNGTLGLRSLGTVTAIMALFAVFFVRWN